MGKGHDLPLKAKYCFCMLSRNIHTWKTELPFWAHRHFTFHDVCALQVTGKTSPYVESTHIGRETRHERCLWCKILHNAVENVFFIRYPELLFCFCCASVQLALRALSDLTCALRHGVGMVTRAKYVYHAPGRYGHKKVWHWPSGLVLASKSLRGLFPS